MNSYTIRVMKVINKVLFVFIIVFILNSCEKIEPSLKDFSISGSIGLENISDDKVIVELILYTDSLLSLTPTFTADNCSVTVNGKLQKSGVTSNDFTNPVEYLVTSKDGISRRYIVKASIDPVVYEIGDMGPAGGYIFYINPNSANDGWKYLEAYSRTISGDVWGSFEASGEPPYRIGGAYSSEIGSGKANTMDMINLDSIEVSAGTICYNLSSVHNGNKYDDWFLPSLEELKLVYNVLHTKDIGSYWALRGIWSSTQSEIVDDMSGAYQMDFDNGKVYDLRKFFTISVIPVRSF